MPKIIRRGWNKNIGRMFMCQSCQSVFMLISGDRATKYIYDICAYVYWCNCCEGDEPHDEVRRTGDDAFEVIEPL